MKRTNQQPGAMVHACNPSYSGGLKFEVSLRQIV
jgi:hypothetical protein